MTNPPWPDPRPETFWDYIRELNEKKKLLFFTTHIMEEAERAAHTVAIIDHGKIIARGSPQELAGQTA